MADNRSKMGAPVSGGGDLTKRQITFLADRGVYVPWNATLDSRDFTVWKPGSQGGLDRVSGADRSKIASAMTSWENGAAK